MINTSDFIIKQKRKYFKATCNLCGSDRGYKTPNHADRPCYTCNSKKANLASQAIRGNRLCSTENCNNKHFAHGFCQKHYEQYRRPSVIGKEAECEICGISFIKNTKKQKYCNSICNAKAYYGRKKNEINKKRANNLNLIEYRKIYASKNKEKRNQNDIIRKTIDINYKLSSNLRSRLSKAIARNQKTCSAIQDLGCSIEDFKKYLESKFTEGMSWNNYGKNGWHIDHIIPISSFDLHNPEELKEACYYTNLQPLWAKDNMRKGNR
jgi:hypothetical protein